MDGLSQIMYNKSQLLKCGGEPMGRQFSTKDKPTVLRKRFIPYEVVDISGDELVFRDDRLMVTKWKAIKPRADLYGGISFTYLNDGIKLARFYDSEGKLLYWYCDIIEIDYDEKNDTYTLSDLLVDIRIMPDGKTQVLDTDELAEALEQGLVTQEQACRALKTLDVLLKKIYSGDFPPAECLKYEY
jgi:predicted RNA-binding protein associated with RNAse of E/G family